eukprot:CAMPEP_0179130816 /NCGR_PEP_ID=MMETSP0796-20121207/62118_1 /TAXON_ID=73915 /ORGANISM="Pyrodinium bahamense, Strain pbaha01" /LENGTH=195 /DNA_ID=CAMNT_0020829725 /DNA_START=406 /DNA_END=988 /DNA_ORIENTATION=+
MPHGSAPRASPGAAARPAAPLRSAAEAHATWGHPASPPRLLGPSRRGGEQAAVCGLLTRSNPSRPAGAVAAAAASHAPSPGRGAAVEGAPLDRDCGDMGPEDEVAVPFDRCDGEGLLERGPDQAGLSHAARTIASITTISVSQNPPRARPVALASMCCSIAARTAALCAASSDRYSGPAAASAAAVASRGPTVAP